MQFKHPSARVASKWLVWVAVALLGFWGLAYWVVPPLLRSAVQDRLGQQLGRVVSIESVSFRPWSLETTVTGVRVGGLTAQEPAQLELASLYIDAELQSLIRLAPVVDALRLEGLVVRVSHLGEGRLDVDDIVAALTRARAPQTPEADTDPARFALYNLEVQDFALELTDRPVEQVHRVSDGVLQVPFLSNLSSHREIKVEPRLAFSFGGSRFESDARTTPFGDGRETDVRLRLPALDLQPFRVYWPSSLGIRPLSAVLDADLTVRFEQRQAPVVEVSGRIALNGLQAQITGTNDGAARALAWDGLTVDVASLRPLERLVRLKSVMLQGLAVQATRAGNGRVDWLAALGSARPSGAASAPDSEAAGWQVVVDEFTAQDARFQWLDRAVQPAALAQVSALKLSAQALRWPQIVGADPARWQGQLQLALGREGAVLPAAAAVTWQGSGGVRGGTTDLQVQDFSLQGLSPYVSAYFTPQVTGQARLQTQLRWGEAAGVGAGASGVGDRVAPLPMTLSGLQLQVDRLRVADAPAPSAPPVEWAQLSVESADIDLTGRRLTLGTVRLVRPQVRLSRLPQGDLSVQSWLPDRTPDASQAAGPPGSPWRVQLGEARVIDGELTWIDTSLPRSEPLRVSRLQATVRDLAWPASQTPAARGARSSPPAATAMTVTAAVRSGDGEPGSLSVQGRLGLEPMRLSAAVKAVELPARAAAPYLAQVLNVELLRAALNADGRVELGWSGSDLSLGWRGDVGVDDLLAHTRSANDGVGGTEELLSWRTLALQGVALRISPTDPVSLEVESTRISDFFARLIISPQGRFNLQDLRPQPTGGAPSAVSAGEASPTPAAPGSAGAAPAAPVMTASAPRIRFGPVELTNGRVLFSDRFIQPSFTTSLTELNGRLSAFASASIPDAPQLADLVMQGRAEGTASVSISGKLNPLLAPLSLDVQARVRDLELSPLSPYSVKYAGHGIERGKLSLNVSYRISPLGRLEASNQLVLNQLTFGDKVEGATTSLPVRLAVALLADRNGVIDINLPISGSLDDPQFRLGPIIFKVVVNLIVKAVTAPFSLLASAFGGGGEELSVVPFAAGTAQLDADARAALDKVAAALAQRPRLRMTVVGTASLEQERDAWKRARLMALVQAEKRRVTATATAAATAPTAPTAAAPASPASAAGATDVTPQEYARYLREAYRRSDIANKPRNLLGFARELPVEDMEALMLASFTVSEDAIRALAVQRGVAVRDYLISRQIGSDRLFLGAAKAVVPEAKWTPRAQLELAMQ